MSSNADFFLKKTLGEDFFETLSKVELWKPGTRTTIDHEEIKTALKIVPRTVMSLLIRELSPMQIGETKEISIPSFNHSDHGKLRVTKHERDVYSGEIEGNTEKYTDRKLAEFKYRSLPGVGLVIMSTFELYDVNDLKEEERSDLNVEMLQKLIDERLNLHDLINKVVDKKIEQKDAVQQLILAKITEKLVESEKQKQQIAELRDIQEKTTPQNDPYFRGMTNGIEVVNAVVNKKEPNFVKPKKDLPLKEFLQKREDKLKKNEYQIQMHKSEHVHCSDCGKNIFDGKIFSGCICFGDDRDKKLYIKKNEDGVKVRFGRGWDPENIEMLLDVLRRKNGY